MYFLLLICFASIMFIWYMFFDALTLNEMEFYWKNFLTQSINKYSKKQKKKKKKKK